MTKDYYEIDVDNDEQNSESDTLESVKKESSKNKKFIHKKSIRKSRVRKNISKNLETENNNIYYDPNPKYEQTEDDFSTPDNSFETDHQNNSNSLETENLNNDNIYKEKLCNKCVVGNCRELCDKRKIIKKTIYVPEKYKEILLNQTSNENKIALLKFFAELESLKSENSYISEEHLSLLLFILILSPYFIFLGIKNNNRMLSFFGIFSFIFTLSNILMKNNIINTFFEKMLF